MLTLTPQASQAIVAIMEAEQVPDGSGLRIAARADEVDAEGRAQLELSLVAEPEADDEVVEQAGAQVFVEPTAARILDDKQLDATLEGERIGFLVVEQASQNGTGPESA